jgi:hypothetical protein
VGAGEGEVFKRLKARAAIPGRCSPHTLRHWGHSSLDMVKRYVALAETDLTARHRTASPADRQIAGSSG